MNKKLKAELDQKKLTVLRAMGFENLNYFRINAFICDYDRHIFNEEYFASHSVEELIEVTKNYDIFIQNFEEFNNLDLEEKFKNVLNLRFGLEDGKARTLEETGAVLNITRERARQLEAKGLRKIRTIRRNMMAAKLVDASDLSDVEKQIVRLHCIEQKNLYEVAEILGLDDGNIHETFRNCMRKLELSPKINNSSLDSDNKTR